MAGKKDVKNQPLKLQCEWNECRVIFNDLGDFYIHIHDHYLQDITPELEKETDLSCKWVDCSFITSCPEDLLRHMYFHAYHTKVKWWGWLCCHELMLGECRAMHNRNIIPELPDGFKCEWADCNVVFDVPDQFYLHVYDHCVFANITVRSGNNFFICNWDKCDYCYKTDPTKPGAGRSKLREHLRTHTKERRYACPWCGSLYCNKTKFTDHFNRQIGTEDHCFQCTHCSKTYSTERILKDHMRHHVSHYKCPHCPMTCPNPSGLRNHIKYKHSDERPFACQHCSYRSKAAYDLQVHLNFHQSDLSYQCHVEGCDYAVRSLQNLRYHFRSKHLTGKTKCYACHLCSKTFAIGFQLTSHLRSTHSFQLPPGHSRFKYKESDDGLYRLQTYRFESVELTEQLMIYDQASSTLHESNGESNKNKQKKIPNKRNMSQNKKVSLISIQKNKKITQKSNKNHIKFAAKSTNPSLTTTVNIIDNPSSTNTTEIPSSSYSNFIPSEVGNISQEIELPTIQNEPSNSTSPEIQQPTPPVDTSLQSVFSNFPILQDNLISNEKDGVMLGDLVKAEDGTYVSVKVEDQLYYLVKEKINDSTAYRLVSEEKCSHLIKK